MPDSKSSMTISCQVCTYENLNGSDKCLMCSSDLRLKNQDSKSSGKNRCPKCTFGNLWGSKMCSICSEPLKQISNPDSKSLDKIMNNGNTKGYMTHLLVEEVAKKVLLAMGMGYRSGLFQFIVKNVNGENSKFGTDDAHFKCRILLKQLKNGGYHFVLLKRSPIPIKNDLHQVIDLGQYSRGPDKNCHVPKPVLDIYSKIVKNAGWKKNIGNCCLPLTMIIGSVWAIMDYEREIGFIIKDGRKIIPMQY